MSQFRICTSAREAIWTFPGGTVWPLNLIIKTKWKKCQRKVDSRFRRYASFQNPLQIMNIWWCSLYLSALARRVMGRRVMTTWWWMSPMRYNKVKEKKNHSIFSDVKSSLPLTSPVLSSPLLRRRTRRPPEEVPPTLLGRTVWTRVACWRRTPPWARPPSPPPAAHLHPNPKRLIWWVGRVIIAVWSSFSSFLRVDFYFWALEQCRDERRSHSESIGNHGFILDYKGLCNYRCM